MRHKKRGKKLYPQWMANAVDEVTSYCAVHRIGGIEDETSVNQLMIHLTRLSNMNLRESWGIFHLMDMVVPGLLTFTEVSSMVQTSLEASEFIKTMKEKPTLGRWTNASLLVILNRAEKQKKKNKTVSSKSAELLMMVYLTCSV